MIFRELGGAESDPYGFNAAVNGVAEMFVDPIARLMDPAFTETLWYYEHSRTEPDIPGSLHPKQIEQLHNDSKHRWLFWGNQAGKTTLGAVDLILLSLGRHPVQKWQPPIKSWASALTWELWENILLPELLTWIPRERLLYAPPPHRQSKRRDILIKADNGEISRISGKAAEQGAERFQSARIHRWWADEEHPEPVYNEALPRLLRFGGDTIHTMTPLKGLTWVYSRVYEPFKMHRPEAASHFCTHAGIADNPSISPEALHELRNELRNNPSQLAAREHGLFVRPVGAVLPFNPETMIEDIPLDHLKDMLRMGTVFGGLDLGKWRWALTLWVATKTGLVFLLDEVFSQNEETDVRAGKLHSLYKSYGITSDQIITRCDCADPKLVTELNGALERIGSDYYVSPVEFRNKIIKVGVDRLENLMVRGAFKVRRGLGNGMTWFLGKNSGKPGTPVEGSRWIWEVNNWQYPKVEEKGKLKIQKDEPDDVTADGADMMDSSRYAVLSYWDLLEPAPPEKPKAPTVEQRIRKELDDLDEIAERAKKGKPYGGVLRQ
jgi:phage terminase large subunit-like protein